jgi:hypothetical protein
VYKEGDTLHERCLLCKRKLKTEESKKLGLGSTCKKKLMKLDKEEKKKRKQKLEEKKRKAELIKGQIKFELEEDKGG